MAHCKINCANAALPAAKRAAVLPRRLMMNSTRRHSPHPLAPFPRRYISDAALYLRRGAFRCLLPLLLLASCSFDYGEATADTSEQPDIIMSEVEYVRVRNGDPIVRFKADTAERYEKKQIMSVREFEFEQFQNHGEEVNVQGNVGAAQIEIDTGNVQMRDGIRIDVISDDISISTNMLFWEDKSRAISAAKEDEVRIERSDGTSFSGKGFSANAREQIFTFDGGIQGVYFEEDEE